VIKMVQAMRHDALPKTLHAEEPSPHVDWSEGEVRLLSEQVPWERNGTPRRAGVSSFGVSGTNAHVILEEAPAIEPRAGEPTAGAQPGAGRADGGAPASLVLRTWPFLVSAVTREALSGQAARLGAYLRENPQVELGALAAALALDRAPLPYRAAIVAGERETLLARFAALERSEAADGLFEGLADHGRTAFLFSGQGSQWAGMGAELYGAFPVFANALDEACAILDAHLGRPLKQLMFASEDSEGAALLGRTQFTQAALFALEVALYRLIRGLGVEPDFLMGHSIGELSAAHVAGVLSLEDACALVAARGGLMGALPDGGAMAAVAASEEEVLASLAGFEDRLTVAAVNGPQAVVVSGELQALEHWEGASFAGGRKVTRLRVSHAFHSQLMAPMLDELRELARGLSFAPPELPIVSNVTGKPAGEELQSADYWVEHVRRAVRFHDGVSFLHEAGVTRFLELGPNGVLSAMAHECLDEPLAAQTLFASSLRARRPEIKEIVGFLAQAQTHGVEIDWEALLGERTAARVELPTYAFQRQRYWLAAAASATDASSLGLGSGEHPLLGAALRLAGEEEGWLFTGRVSLNSHPWLADHAVMGQVLMPGTGFVELALAAGEKVGAEIVEELTLERPLLFGEEGAMQIQLTVSEPDAAGKRSVSIYSRPQSLVEDEAEHAAEWVRHASGILDGGSPPPVAVGAEEPGDSGPAGFAGGAWPPAGAEQLDSEFLYDRLAEAGYNYGPMFQGLRSAWRVGEDLYAEVALDTEHGAEAGRFGVHPALLDATLHAAFLGALDDGQASAVEVPFAFSGVRLQGRGAGVLRVRLSRSGEALSLTALDQAGAPALSIQALETRAIDQSQMGVSAPGAHDSLYELQWVALQSTPPNGSQIQAVVLGDGRTTGLAEAAAGLELERYPSLDALAAALEDGAGAPELVLVDAAASAGEGEPSIGAEAGAAPALDGLAARIRKLTAQTLELLQGWIADERFADARLLLVTEGALAVDADEVPSLLQGALAGLMRSAQSEHPGRFGLVDLAADGVSSGLLYGALRSDEPEIALRGDALYAPRLGRVTVSPADGDAPADGDGLAQERLEQSGTVLITGGTGGLGALLARHLVGERGVKRLLLASRSGGEAPGAQALAEQLSELGCDVQLAACDVSDRAQLKALLASVAQEHPVSVAIHAAGVIDDGTIASLDGERLARVMSPKVDAAVNLHELAGQAELIFFSSAAATVGSPGQGNYAAANAFLDTLALHRRASGLPGTSLAWGAWDQAAGMTGELSAADRARLARVGLAPLSGELGLELFDRARTLEQALLVPMRLETSSLRAQAKAGMLPAVLRGLIRMPARRASTGEDSLATRLAQAPESEWDGIVAELVRGHVAGVLGHPSAEAVDPDRAFQELGFDSLAAVELKNRLGRATGLKIPSTLIFDHPTPAAVARYLRGVAVPAGSERAELEPGEAEIREALSSIPLSQLRGAGLMETLMELAGGSDGRVALAGEEDEDEGGEGIDTMDVAGLVERTLKKQAEFEGQATELDDWGS
jgi:acyl transferase domain-containing protein/acyl carrier protein